MTVCPLSPRWFLAEYHHSRIRFKAQINRSMQILDKTLATAALAGLMVWSAAAQNLVTNGAFETPTGNNSFGPGSTGLTGWTVDTSPPDGVYLGVAASLVVNYSQSLELTANTSTNRTTGGGISQTIATTQGAMYFISIDV